MTEDLHGPPLRSHALPAPAQKEPPPPKKSRRRPKRVAAAQKESPPPVTNLQHFARVHRIAELKMSGRASGGAVKRQREQEEDDDDHEEEGEPECLEATAHPMLPTLPLTLLAVVKSYHGTLVWAQLCNPQGVTLFSFVHILPGVPRPFAGAPVYRMSLTHGERLRAVGCGLKGKLARLLSLGADRTSTQTITATSTVSTASTTMPFTVIREPKLPQPPQSQARS